MDGFGEAYYDLLVLRTEAKNEGDGKLADIIDLFEKEVLVDKKPVFIHYDMIRNYSYTVAEIQKKYYLYMEHILDNYVDKMKDAIENNPKLVHKGKSFTNHIVYTLQRILLTCIFSEETKMLWRISIDSKMRQINILIYRN